MNALCIIPPAVRTKAQPVAASVRIPPGTYEVWYWPITTPEMITNDAFKCAVECRWRLAGERDFTDEGKATNEIIGNPGHVPGGIVGGLPGQLPSDFVNFDFRFEDSPGGGTTVPPGAEFVRITGIPIAGNNGGNIYCGWVIAAFDSQNNAIQFDVGTRGS